MINDELKFLELKDFGLTIGAAPKIASSTLHESLKAYYGVDNVQWIPEVNVLRPKMVAGDVVIWTRDPLDRFVSLWRNKCVEPYGRLHGHEAIQGMTPDQLWRYSINNDNHHWLPVSYLIRHLPIHTGVHLVPIEDVTEWWDYCLPNVPRLDRNSTINKDVAFEFNFMHEFKARYQLDQEMHDTACGWRNHERHYD